MILHLSLWTGLQCPTCSYVTLAPDAEVNSAVRSVVDTLLNTLQTKECAQHLTAPTPAVTKSLILPFHQTSRGYRFTKAYTRNLIYRGHVWLE